MVPKVCIVLFAKKKYEHVLKQNILNGREYTGYMLQEQKVEDENERRREAIEKNEKRDECLFYNLTRRHWCLRGRSLLGTTSENRSNTSKKYD